VKWVVGDSGVRSNHGVIAWGKVGSSEIFFWLHGLPSWCDLRLFVDKEGGATKRRKRHKMVFFGVRRPVALWLNPLRKQFDFLDCGSPAAAFSHASLLAFAGGGAAKVFSARGSEAGVLSRQQGCLGPKRQQAAAVQGLRLGEVTFGAVGCKSAPLPA
jgi:hypothetical protein